MDTRTAAIYARKSSDNEAGVARQVELARDFITVQKWTVAEPHIYTDNDVSGATFDRPGLNALLAALAATPQPFDVLVVMDASRLGRNMEETLPLQGRIIRAGVRIFHYQDGQELLLSTPVQKLVASVANFSHEDFRYQIQAKTRAALRKKAEQGHVTGGRVFGYDIHCSGCGKARPCSCQAHKVRVINEAQAAVIRFIFQRVADGHGLRSIAREVHKPVTTIRNMLEHSIYRGVVRYSGITLDQPHLRIVEETLWQSAHARLAKTRQVYTGHRKPNGTLVGRPETGLVSHHLLSGLLRCGGCGSAMTPIVRPSKTGKVRRYYGCSGFYKQGRACANHGLVPYDKITDGIIDKFGADMMLGAVVQARAEAERQSQHLSVEREQVKARIAGLEQELGNLASAIAGGHAPRTLLDAIAKREAERRDHQARLEHLEGMTLDTSILDATFFEALQRVEGKLRGPGARQVLQRLLPEPLVVTAADEGGWVYEGVAVLTYPGMEILHDPVNGFISTKLPACPKSPVPVGRPWITPCVSGSASRNLRR